MGAHWQGGVTAADEVDELAEKAVLFHKKVTLSGMDTAVRTTRVDTGRARAGWHVAKSDASGFEGFGPGGSAGAPASGAQVVGADAAMAGLRIGESTYIVDNVKYVSFLNDGTIHTGGDHMVEAALERMNREREGVF